MKPKIYLYVMALIVVIAVIRLMQRSESASDVMQVRDAVTDSPTVRVPGVAPSPIAAPVALPNLKTAPVPAVLPKPVK
jgi:hypothetical protein